MRGSGALGRRDEDDFERWLADGYAKAYRTAFLILHNHQDAEEAVQEAFLRAWRFRAAVPEGDGVQPWMYRVVVNSCLTKLRSERNAKQRRTTLSGPDPSSTICDPEESATSTETQREVLGAIAGLPEHLRIVVVLRYYAGLSEKEIATAIHRRPGTVKSRIHEAKARLGNDPGLAGYRSAPLACVDGSTND